LLPLNPDFLYAALDTIAYAAFIMESRMNFVNAINLNRKSGSSDFPLPANTEVHRQRLFPWLQYEPGGNIAGSKKRRPGPGFPAWLRQPHWHEVR